MALITCPECGKQVSSVASTCPYCGYPVSGDSDSGFVKIKTPYQIEGVRQRLFRKPMASIFGTGVSWTGELGSTARFKVDGPTLVSIDLGNDVKFFKTMVYPNTSYKLEYVRTRWSLAEYDLVEI